MAAFPSLKLVSFKEGNEGYIKTVLQTELLAECVHTTLYYCCFVFVWHWSDSSRGHSHSHPTVTHSAVGPMYAMGTPVPPHHHQGTDGTTEKKKKKEEKDREKHEKEKEKVRYCWVVFLSTVKQKIWSNCWGTSIKSLPAFSVPYETFVNMLLYGWLTH